MPRRVPVSLLAIALLGATHQVNAQGEWDYELITFLWASSLDGQEGIGDTVVDVDASFSDLLEFVDIGFAARFAARRDAITWFGEGSFVELEARAPVPNGSAELETSQTFGEAGLAYEFRDGLAVYGGLRYQNLDTRLTTTFLGRFESEADWLDAMVGLRWTPIRSDTWLAWARGDIGGGGSDLVWLAEVGAGYRFGTRWSSYLAYRLLDTDYQSSDFSYDVTQSGFAIGFGFSF